MKFELFIYIFQNINFHMIYMKAEATEILPGFEIPILA